MVQYGVRVCSQATPHCDARLWPITRDAWYKMCSMFNKMLLFPVEDFNFYASVDHLIEQPTASKKCYPSGSVEMLMFYSYPLGNKDSCSQILITMHECIRGGGLPLNIICHSHATIPQVIGL
jgi:hypothetical protein